MRMSKELLEVLEDPRAVVQHIEMHDRGKEVYVSVSVILDYTSKLEEKVTLESDCVGKTDIFITKES